MDLWQTVRWTWNKYCWNSIIKEVDVLIKWHSKHCFLGNSIKNQPTSSFWCHCIFFDDVYIIWLNKFEWTSHSKHGIFCTCAATVHCHCVAFYWQMCLNCLGRVYLVLVWSSAISTHVSHQCVSHHYRFVSQYQIYPNVKKQISRSQKRYFSSQIEL